MASEEDSPYAREIQTTPFASTHIELITWEVEVSQESKWGPSTWTMCDAAFHQLMKDHLLAKKPSFPYQYKDLTTGDTTDYLVDLDHMTQKILGTNHTRKIRGVVYVNMNQR